MNLDIKDHDSGGWTAVASNASRDRDGEIIDAGAFRPLPASIPTHLTHDFTKLAGSCRPFYKGSELWVEGRFASNDHGVEARALVTQGHLAHMSVVMAGTVKERGADGYTHIVAAELVAADFVSIPANREARVLTSRSHEPQRQTYLASGALALAQAQLLLLDLDEYEAKRRVSVPSCALRDAEDLLRRMPR